MDTRRNIAGGMEASDMDRLRRVLRRIGAALGRLTTSQRLLIVSLALVMAMSLFLVALWTAKPDMVELLPGASAAEQQRAASFLGAQQVEHKVGPGGRVLVPAETRTTVLARMSQDGALPADNVVLFNNLAAKSPWTMSGDQRKQQEAIAVQNELSTIIGQFRGVRKASVILDVPAASGLGAAVRKPTASATVFTSTGRPLDQDTVDAVANLIASSRAGLNLESVRVIDGSTNQQRRARPDSAAVASNYIEHAAMVEDRVRDKLLDLLSYIPGVIVAVNAQVDVRQTTRDTRKVLEPGKGTVTAPVRETTSTKEDAAASAGAEAGVRSNVGLDINRAGGPGAKTSDTKSEAEMKTEFGTSVERVVDPRGMPTKINATINVPRAYFVARWRSQQAAGAGGAAPAGAPAAPAEQDLAPVVQAEVERITAGVKPQVDASIASGEGGAGVQGEVVVTMIPDAIDMADAARASLAGAGGGALALGLGAGPLVKNVGLGALALTAVGMMLLMIRKSNKALALPSAEELVGIPPALQKTTDLVGEADEADNALSGIELTDDVIRTRKLREQVEDVVKSKPSDAAQLLNRWISVHE